MCKHVLVQELREVGYTHVAKNTKGATDTINPLDHHYPLPNLCQIQSYPPLNGIQELDT